MPATVVRQADTGVSPTRPPRADEPTADDVAGMAWWGALSQVKRLFWLTQAAGTAAGASAAAAWAAFKQADQPMSAARAIDSADDMQSGQGDR